MLRMRRMTLSLYIIYVEETIPQIQTLLQNLIKERSRYFVASSPWALIRPCRLHIKGKEKLILFYVIISHLFLFAASIQSFSSVVLLYSTLQWIQLMKGTILHDGSVLTQYSTLLNNCCIKLKIALFSILNGSTKLSTIFALLDTLTLGLR